MYNKISEYYDKIFPKNVKKLDFLIENLPKGKVLDLACGSGLYVNELNKLGYLAEGYDLDESMVKIAKDRYPNLAVYKKNMLDLSQVNNYEGVYSIGNSIVHLEGLDEITRLIKKIYIALKENGKIIIQIINYNRIIKRKITSLPTIVFAEGRFVREYQLINNKILFKTSLYYNHKVVKEQVTLYPLLRDDLIETLKQKGFKNIKTYGDFIKNEFVEKESLHLIVTAQK